MLRVSGSASDQTTLDEMNPFPSLLKECAAWVPERKREREEGRTEREKEREKRRDGGRRRPAHTHMVLERLLRRLRHILGQDNREQCRAFTLPFWTHITNAALCCLQGPLSSSLLPATHTQNGFRA